MKPYKAGARLLYRLFSWGLTIVSPIKPLFRLVLRVLTGHKHSIRGHILPVNTRLGQPVQTRLTREVLAELINKSTAVGAMSECLCRAVGKCKEYPEDLGCLVLGESVHSLHPDLGRAIGHEEAMAVVDRALSLGLSPMVVHFKGDALLWSLEHSKMLTVCFCCPCHCLLRDALALQGNGEGKLTGLPGLVIELDERNCAGCGRCQAACVAGAIHLTNNMAEIEHPRCVCCGRCAMACPTGAISMRTTGDSDAVSLIRVYSHRTVDKSVFKT